MDYHCVEDPARLLKDFNWYEVPIQHQDGPSDLPAVQLFLPDVQEQYRAGHIGTGEMAIRLVVSVSRTKGIADLFENTERVLNAIETSHVNGLVDAYLSGTLVKPFGFTINEPFSTQISLNAPIVLTCTVRPFERGKR